jgi:outer membrane protein assembly factor BamC
LNRHPAISPARLALTTLAAALALAGCTSNEGLLSGEKVDYRSAAVKSKPLDIPPDLTQLSRENRYATQGGVVSAAGAPGSATAPAPSASAAPAVAGVRVERSGDMRWLVVPLPPEQVWPIVKAFWGERGFKLDTEKPEIGLMETEWAENRAKLPNDLIRSAIGRFISNLYDTGERDRFRTRIERTATGSEVFVTHRGLEEVYTNDQKESTVWAPRPSDPALEAEFLGRLMARLGTPETAARTAVAAAPDMSRARPVGGSAAALEVDEPFDRAWRRVGLALDRSGFSVEDRDRAGGLYFVRYVDPKFAGQDEPGWWDRLTGKAGDQPRGPVRYRIAVKAAGEKTTVSVLTSTGTPEAGENGQRIVAQLVKELR